MTPNRDQKLAAILDLVYEYGNLMAAAQGDLECDPPFRSSCDDAFILGCRKICDFLMNDNREKDDVLATDFLPPGSVPKWTLPIWEANWRAVMNKYLAHITYQRTENRRAMGLPLWDHMVWVPQLRDEFKKAWKEFLVAVTDSDFRAEFEKQLKQCQAKDGFQKVILA